MKSILLLHFLELKLLAVFEPQGKKGKILAKEPQETKTAGFHHGLENGCIKRLARPKKP